MSLLVFRLEIVLGTRLIPSARVESEVGRTEVYDMLVNMLPNANPYIVVGTPFLFNYMHGTTSVTPAWRNSVGDVRLNYCIRSL